MDKTWQFDVNLAKTFDSHWDAKLSFNDVFNSARKSSFTIYSGQRDVTNTRFNTMRGVELTVGYKFNIAKSKYKGKGAGQAEKDRL